MRFPRWLSTGLQVVATLGQIWNTVSPVVTWEQAPQIAAGIGALQVALAAIAHSYNPDGTPATVAYEKPFKKYIHTQDSIQESAESD